MYKFSLVLLAICLHASDVRISEVMSNPQGSEYENEFIELFNQSDHVIYINGWVLSDGTGVDTLIHWSGPEGVQGQSYALILDPGYNFDSGPYATIIPDSIPLYTISTDASLGSGGLANSGEMVIIRNQDSSTTSQMSWSSASDNGFSWERVSLSTPDSTSEWEQSTVENGTPGVRNSVTPALWDIWLNRVDVTQTVVGEPIKALLSLSNIGENIISEYSVFIVYDENQNNEFEINEWTFFEEYSTPLEPQDMIEIPVELFHLQSGIHKFAAHVFTAGDESTDNNTIRFEIRGKYPENTISVTEIMHSPSSEQGGEWLELKNNSPTPVSVQGWSLADANQTFHLISDTPRFLQPNSLITLINHVEMMDYFSLTPEQVILMDSWPTLNSTSDSVRIYDATGHSISSVFYRGSWSGAAVSLERRHPSHLPLAEENWLPSTQPAGGTPSRKNTQQLKHLAAQIESVEVISGQPVGPASVSIMIHFSNQGLDTLYSLKIEGGVPRIWEGELLSFASDSLTIITPEMAPGFSELLITILHDQIFLADTTIQLVLGFPGNQIALNEIHYLPNEDQTEYLEFINTSYGLLDVEGWHFRDRSGSQGIISGQVAVPVDGLFIICKDAGIMSDWVSQNTLVVELDAWPSLNNASDSIFIYDPLGNLQLSQGYSSLQGGEFGKSMERLALWKPADADVSWGTCVDPTGMTPGRQNSVQVPSMNLILNEIQILDSILWVDQRFMIQLEIINAGNESVNTAMVYLQATGDDEILIDHDESLSFIGIGDTLLYRIEVELNQCGWIDVSANIAHESDSFQEDNQLGLQLYLSCKNTSIIINEVMPVPLPGGVEWVELYNRGDRSVDIQDWHVSDNSLAEKTISDSTFKLSPGCYLLLSGGGYQSSDFEESPTQMVTGFPTLNNSEDELILYDPQGFRVDEVSWNEFTAMAEGRSLERIRSDASGLDPRNWGICLNAAGSTAGEENSLDLKELPAQLSVHLSPNPFTPDGDGLADEVIIYYDLPVEQGLISMVIFDMAGRKIAEPVLGKAVSHRGQISWQGDANYGGKAVTGLYIMKLLIDDLGGDVHEVLKKIYLVR